MSNVVVSNIFNIGIVIGLPILLLGGINSINFSYIDIIMMIVSALLLFIFSFNDKFNFERFKNKILAVHIHDNFGEHDEHLLPFDGTNNYEKVMTKLKENNYDSPITLELCYRKEYKEKYSLIEFYNEAYKRGTKLKDIIDK